ncbi:MAG: DUF1588 domain-containing protein [Gemmataceae bacterium]
MIFNMLFLFRQCQRLRCGLVLAFGIAVATFLLLVPPAARGADTFRQTIAPFLRRHCVKCHGPGKQKGKLALHTIDADLPRGKDVEKWQAIVERLILNEMPPDSQPRPDARAVQHVVAWIKTELAKGGRTADDADRKLLLPGHGNRVDHDALFSGDFNGPTASPARLWRLSPHLYSTFVPRVSHLGKSKGKKGNSIAQAFSTASGEGFKDYASLFVIDEPTINQLMRNAQQIVEAQTGQGRGGKAAKEFQPLVDPRHTPTDAEIQKAIRRQFQLVLLREPNTDEMRRFTELMRKNMKDAGQAIGVKSTLATVLMLPEALYRLELGQGAPDEYGRRMLAPRELAYAIAFALTDDAPDAALRRAVEQGRLATTADVRREVARLLNDKSIAKPRIMRFFEEYFEFPLIQDVFKDMKKESRGQWRPEVLVSDTRYLIQYILDKDLDVLKELLTTNKSFVNYRIDRKKGPVPARTNKNNKPGKNGKRKPRQPEMHDWYSLPEDWQWTAKQPIELPQEQRAGILTQPSWLGGFATNNETHAIRRGKWVRERLLGGFVPDLPITVDAQLPDNPTKTLRQRMVVTKQEYCWQCHRKMNDLGLTFENYDYLGRYRATELDKPVDATGKIAYSGDGKLDGAVPNAVALIHKLADSPRVRQVFVRHAFRFWMGRNETLTDSPTLRAADQAYVESGGSMKALITALLTSDSFLYRYASLKHRTAERPISSKKERQ